MRLWSWYTYFFSYFTDCISGQEKQPLPASCISSTIVPTASLSTVPIATYTPSSTANSAIHFTTSSSTAGPEVIKPSSTELKVSVLEVKNRVLFVKGCWCSLPNNYVQQQQGIMGRQKMKYMLTGPLGRQFIHLTVGSYKFWLSVAEACSYSYIIL